MCLKCTQTSSVAYGKGFKQKVSLCKTVQLWGENKNYKYTKKSSLCRDTFINPIDLEEGFDSRSYILTVWERK